MINENNYKVKSEYHANMRIGFFYLLRKSCLRDLWEYSFCAKDGLNIDSELAADKIDEFLYTQSPAQWFLRMELISHAEKYSIKTLWIVEVNYYWNYVCIKGRNLGYIGRNEIMIEIDKLLNNNDEKK